MNGIFRRDRRKSCSKTVTATMHRISSLNVQSGLEPDGKNGVQKRVNRVSDQLVLKENNFSMEYIPQARVLVSYGYIIYKMEYCQIKALVDYRERGYVEVYGAYQIRRYQQANMGDVPGNVQVEYKSDEPFRLYAHYENFEKCMEEISKRPGVNCSIR